LAFIVSESFFFGRLKEIKKQKEVERMRHTHKKEQSL